MRRAHQAGVDPGITTAPTCRRSRMDAPCPPPPCTNWPHVTTARPHTVHRGNSKQGSSYPGAPAPILGPEPQPYLGLTLSPAHERGKGTVMKYRILAVVAFTCSSALAQAPPQPVAPMRPEVQGPSTQGPASGDSRSSEPDTSERQVGGLPLLGTLGAGPAPASEPASPAAEPPTRVDIAPFGTSLDPATANGGPN